VGDFVVRKGIDHAWRNVIANGADDGRLVTTAFDEPAGAVRVPFPSDLPPVLAEGLRRAGIGDLYAHQNEALGEAGHVISTSGTASGKSLSFNLPVLESLALDPKSRALYLYPTKALAQDQARKLSALTLPFLNHAIYDGDTPREDRPGLRRRSNLILTNPDMVNVGLLPHHQGWGDFMANLRWIVVDEAHTYRGVFGSHVANVLRRLRRVARLYRAEPTFLLASATIANPGELAERLIGEPVSVVSSDGAPKAGRRIVIWNPPVIDERTQRRRSTLSEGAELLADLVAEGMRTICFLRSRKGIELILRFAKLRLEERGKHDLAARIAPYRAGYTPQQRREIESRLVRHRRARRVDLRHLSRDRRELAADVGAGGPALRRPRRLRSRRGCPRSVLLPPSG
jgi:DEAD/DEAH box helicase domain-containing protein